MANKTQFNLICPNEGLNPSPRFRNVPASTRGIASLAQMQYTLTPLIPLVFLTRQPGNAPHFSRDCYIFFQQSNPIRIVKGFLLLLVQQVWAAIIELP